MLCALQMVWEQGVVVIVNLTKLSDLGLVSVIEINQKNKLHYFNIEEVWALYNIVWTS